jgi:hypothetical protein
LTGIRSLRLFAKAAVVRLNATVFIGYFVSTDRFAKSLVESPGGMLHVVASHSLCSRACRSWRVLLVKKVAF